MTGRDKSGDQLVASIRKSKSGTVARKTATRSASGKSPAATATPENRARKPVVRKPARKQGVYSYGRRVWPD